MAEARAFRDDAQRDEVLWTIATLARRGIAANSSGDDAHNRQLLALTREGRRSDPMPDVEKFNGAWIWENGCRLWGRERWRSSPDDRAMLLAALAFCAGMWWGIDGSDLPLEVRNLLDLVAGGDHDGIDSWLRDPWA